ncbi:FliM/FliN family flagellar motor switch protein [Candidatus Sneabacter namystus]|uniref:Flagellar motor switch protein FliM n=1 Tax=Candidatus Sneabacter namystus TaxID=2601646 RepID=A0A5C0UIQ0_9RICK|nr:FliM/FliN family flagellar motor switch protein [Candidatus Sneabacter namystus]QEK39667.1 hypothetical protein FZC37_01830 [Candidatus Sneabacter namystus]
MSSSKQTDSNINTSSKNVIKTQKQGLLEILHEYSGAYGRQFSTVHDSFLEKFCHVVEQELKKIFLFSIRCKISQRYVVPDKESLLSIFAPDATKSAFCVDEEKSMCGVIVFSHDFTCTFLDILLGGSGKAERDNVSKSDTLIGKSILKKVTSAIFNAASASYDSVQTYSEKVVSLRETEKDVIQDLHMQVDNGSLVISSFLIHSESFSGELFLALPRIMFDSIYNGFNNDESNDSVSWKAQLFKSIGRIPLRISANMEDKKLWKLSEVINIKVGDTILLARCSQYDITLSCKNTKIAKGTIGELDNQVSLHLTEV